MQAAARAAGAAFDPIAYCYDSCNRRMWRRRAKLGGLANWGRFARRTFSPAAVRQVYTGVVSHKRRGSSSLVLCHSSRREVFRPRYGPRKAVKTRPNDRKAVTLREKAKAQEMSRFELSCPHDTKHLLSSYGRSNSRLGASWLFSPGIIGKSCKALKAATP